MAFQSGSTSSLDASSGPAACLVLGDDPPPSSLPNSVSAQATGPEGQASFLPRCGGRSPGRRPALLSGSDRSTRARPRLVHPLLFKLAGEGIATPWDAQPPLPPLHACFTSRPRSPPVPSRRLVPLAGSFLRQPPPPPSPTLTHDAHRELAGRVDANPLSSPCQLDAAPHRPLSPPARLALSSLP